LWQFGQYHPCWSGITGGGKLNTCSMLLGHCLQAAVPDNVQQQENMISPLILATYLKRRLATFQDFLLAKYFH